MSQEFVIHLAKNALLTTLLVSSPLLLAGLIVGLSVSIVQAVTQINEMTMTFIPKIIAVVLALIIFLPWMMNMMLTFTQEIFQYMVDIAK
ncbi:flagellar biosynthesis protein FliQ [candidate division KSB1 bacterium]|nr:flagellar biosynthesis protein FliQ [candidate division KSB1 bacterium]